MTMVQLCGNRCQDRFQLIAGETDFIANQTQQTLLGRVQRAVGVSGKTEDLDEHALQGGTAADFAAELGEYGVDIELVLLALIEQSFGGLALLRGQFHILHDAGSHADLVPGNPAVSLAEMAHGREYRSKKGGLDAKLVAAWQAALRPGPGAPACGLFKFPTQAAVEIAAHHRPQRGADGPAQHETEGAAGKRSPP